MCCSRRRRTRSRNSAGTWSRSVTTLASKIACCSAGLIFSSSAAVTTFPDTDQFYLPSRSRRVDHAVCELRSARSSDRCRDHRARHLGFGVQRWVGSDDRDYGERHSVPSNDNSAMPSPHLRAAVGLAGALNYLPRHPAGDRPEVGRPWTRPRLVLTSRPARRCRSQQPISPPVVPCARWAGHRPSRRPSRGKPLAPLQHRTYEAACPERRVGTGPRHRSSHMSRRSRGLTSAAIPQLQRTPGRYRKSR